MTTIVTVQTSEHPANVIVRQKTEGQEGHNVTDNETVVPAGSEQDFTVDAGVQLLVVEDRRAPEPVAVEEEPAAA